MIFKYKARDPKGNEIKGSVDTPSKQEAAQVLRSKNLFIVSIQEQTGAGSSASILSKLSRAGFSDITDFTRQLATMMNAGLTLVESIALLSRQSSNPALKNILNSIEEDIRGGKTFAKALQKHPKQFNKIYVSLISAGEESGKLDEVLMRLAENMEKDRQFKSQVKTAMIYPIIVIIGMILLSIGMMIFVVPQLTEIYDSFDVELPLTTQILIGTSDFLVVFWWTIPIAVIAIIIWLPRFFATDSGARIKDTIVLHLPVWGSLKKDTIMTELTSTLSLLIGAGVPILDSMDIVAGALGSVRYSEGIREAEAKVERGTPMGQVFQNNTVFPPLFGQMITVGEETGKMDETLGRIAVFYEAAATEKVKRLTASLEPIILVVLGIGVAFLVLSIVLPMYQLTEAF